MNLFISQIYYTIINTNQIESIQLKSKILIILIISIHESQTKSFYLKKDM